MKYKLKKTRTS